MDYRRQNGVRIKIVRIFNTYGPRMNPDDGRVVSNFIVRALRGEDITIYGDGSQTRSFQYVSDWGEGNGAHDGYPDEVTGPVNIGNPGEFTILELASPHPGAYGLLLADSLPSVALRTTRDNAVPTSGLQANCSADGGRRYSSAKGSREPSPTSKALSDKPILYII